MFRRGGCAFNKIAVRRNPNNERMKPESRIAESPNPESLGRTTEFFSTVFRFCSLRCLLLLFHIEPGRRGFEQKQTKETESPPNSRRRMRIGRGISQHVGFLDVFSPNARQNPLCEDICRAPESPNDDLIAFHLAFGFRYILGVRHSDELTIQVKLMSIFCRRACDCYLSNSSTLEIRCC